jgi:sugar phosphate permease
LPEKERALILAERKGDHDTTGGRNGRARWDLVLCQPAIWALMGARLLTDPVWYFLNFWLPKYMSAERHLDQVQLAGLWRVYLAGDIGFLASGFVAGFLISRGCESLLAQRRVMLACARAVGGAFARRWRSLCFCVRAGPGPHRVALLPDNLYY